MNEENIYNKLTDILDKMGGNFSILEDEIDVDLQMEYFEFSKNFKHSREAEEIMNSKDEIFSKDLSEDDKKKRFVELASMDDIDAFKTIGEYLQNPESNYLKSWALLAYQESRMLLESRLLDENQIFISTGLGGRDNKLRYFASIMSIGDVDYNPTQQNVLKNELEFILKNNNSVMEEINFQNNFATLTVLIPLNVPIKQIFDKVIAECNSLGPFLEKEFIITNIRKLSITEIRQFIKEKREKKSSKK